MFNIFTKSLKIGDDILYVETGLIANESDASVVVKFGKNTVLCTLNFSKASQNNDFFPLTVNYVEKFYAAGKIPKGYYKREGRMTQKEILISRLIDRAIRPCFEDDFRQEVGVMCTLLSYDGKSEVDILSALGVAVALKISGLPLKDFTVSSRIGYVNGEYILNPNNEQLAKSQMDVVVACTKDCVMMLEGEFNELSKETVLGALKFALEHSAPIIDFINEFAAEVGVKKVSFERKNYDRITKEINEQFLEKLTNVVLLNIQDKQGRKNKIEEVKEEIIKHFEEKLVSGEILKSDLLTTISKIEEHIVRHKILSEKTRLDGRVLDEIRSIDIRSNVLPVVHGSSLFTRGRTQVLSVTTLGGEADEQMLDALTDTSISERFSLHYNFNPYSAGEPTSPRAPGRREIGHGRLAYKGLKNLIPIKEEFPYSIRIVSEVTGSDGSTSMATLCSGCLSLISAGVPLKNYVAGIAMGLIKEENEFLVLTDIMAEEDYLGDMDFKVIATDKGITAIQMDLKISGIPLNIMESAFEDAIIATDKILLKMKASTDNADLKNISLNKNAPKFSKFKINDKDIPIVIGKGGNTIKEISKNFSVKINIAKDGSVEIFEDGSMSRVDEAKIHITELLNAGPKGENRRFSNDFKGSNSNEERRDRKPRPEIDEDFFSNKPQVQGSRQQERRPAFEQKFGNKNRFSKDKNDRHFGGRKGNFNKKDDTKVVGFFSKIVKKIKGN